jgi:two-component system chemotaxis sensor kinase CheA
MAPPRALTEFVAEATEIIETLSRDVLILDQQRGHEPDPDRLNAIFRAAHSLKGLAGMFGVEGLSHLAHRAEDVLDGLRLGKLPLDDALLDALLEALDVFQAQLGDLSLGEARDATRLAAEDLEARLTTLATGGDHDDEDVLDQVGIDPAVRAVFTEYEEHRLRENVKKGVAVWKVRAVFGLDDFDQRLSQVTGRLKPLGEVVSTLPSSQPGDDASIAFDLVFGSGRTQQEIEAAVEGLAQVAPLTTKKVARPLSKAREPSNTGPALRALPHPGPSSDSAFMTSSPSGVRAPGSNEASLRSLTQTVRVDISRLDGLMNSIGELLLIRSNIDRLAEAARNLSPGAAALPKLWGQELQRETRALERKLDELQKGVLDVRMVPLGQVFDKLARLMRRLVRESGKECDFDVSGGDVELDKLIVEELSDPLMHLLRNALDHGIERPDARVEQGKPGRGRIRLRARQQGNHVSIEVGDDGAGMDEARIRQVAVQRGLVSADDTDDMERRELLNLVFLPGFSTRTDVSELSGRGVGLDVVKTNLQRLSGLIDIDSRKGTGTTFVLTLPLTLAIIRALMVTVSGRTYAIPLNAVLEIVSVKTDELKTIERKEVIEVRGQTLPFVRLARVFELPEAPRPQHFVVIVGLAQQRLGLAVDELAGQLDIVTKPLSGRLRSVPGISGATELGDRRAVLVVDVGQLMEELLRQKAVS